MSARYRVKEHRNRYTPQRRLLGMWFDMARPQVSMQAATEVIKQKQKPVPGSDALPQGR